MPTPNPPLWEMSSEMKKWLQDDHVGIEPLKFTSTLCDTILTEINDPLRQAMERKLMDDMRSEIEKAMRVPKRYMDPDLGLCMEIKKPEKPMKSKTVKLTIYYDNGKPFTVNNVRNWSVDDDRNIHYSAFKNKSGSRMDFTFSSTSGDVSVVITYDGDKTTVNNFNSNNVTVNIDVKRH